MRIGAFLIALLLLLPLIACNEEPPTLPILSDDGSYVDPELAGRQLMAMAGWPAMDETGEPLKIEAPLPAQADKCDIAWIDRHVLTGDIAYYEARLRVGPGPYDTIGIHRVVRERRPYIPIRSQRSVLLLHGDFKDFAGMFLPGFVSPNQDDGAGLAVHLADADIDVWGISQSWTLVPSGEADLTFMAGWGMQRQVNDLRTAIEVARVVRLLSGNGYRQMLLLGYSSGAASGFVYLGQESQLPRGLRKVSGFIPVDYGLVTDHLGWIAANCGDVGFMENEIASGRHYYVNPFGLFGPPAVADPSGASALIPGMTNLQASIALAVYAPYPAIPEVTYHFLAGTFDSDGMPTGLQYTPISTWLDFINHAPPYEAIQFMLDYARASCAPEGVPWDDHLGDIQVPVLWVEAAGGGAPMVRATLERIASADVTELVVQLHPAEEVLIDFAHIDLFTADDAPALMWNPAKDWIVAHSPR